MAKLYSSLNTDRNGRRSWGRYTGDEQVHRLGDEFVVARVQNWEHQVQVQLDDDGNCQILARRLRDGHYEVIYNDLVANLVEPLKVVAVSQPADVTALEVDVQQFLKESA